MEGSIHSMYICEIVSKRYRGPMVASGVVVINFGFLLVYILGSFTHWQGRVGSVYVHFLLDLFNECAFCNIKHDWPKCYFQTTALVSSIFPLLAFFGIFIIPESPAWLIRQKQDFHGAKKSLSRLHRSPLQFAEEVRSFSTIAAIAEYMAHFVCIINFRFFSLTILWKKKFLHRWIQLQSHQRKSVD